MKPIFCFLILNLLLCISTRLWAQQPTDTIYAQLAETAVVVDGKDNDECWAKAEWHPINNAWIPYGQQPAISDFSGQFKLSWDSLYLYVFVEIVDDSLSDDHPNPADMYWEDDCLEIFIDEDYSKGNHERNNNAFAYHMSIFYDAVDIGANGEIVNYKNNLSIVMDTIAPNTYNWEIAVKVYDATFKMNNPEASRVYLRHNKLMGLSLAYCDNDETTGREHFMGSNYLSRAVANNNWINADNFGTLLLVDPNYVETVSVQELVKHVACKVYPNPADSRIQLQFNSNTSIAGSVEILDLSGRLLRTVQNVRSNDVIPVDDLQVGTYLIRVQTNNQILHSVFIKR